MTRAKLAQQRLMNQRLAAAQVHAPADVVRWLGAVQAQDFEDLLRPTVVVNGRVVGFWSRRLAAGSIRIALQPFTPLAPTARRAVSSAIQRYTPFLTEAA
jgi:Winged helix DNA-binding domain